MPSSTYLAAIPAPAHDAAVWSARIGRQNVAQFALVTVLQTQFCPAPSPFLPLPFLPHPRSGEAGWG